MSTYTRLLKVFFFEIFNGPGLSKISKLIKLKTFCWLRFEKNEIGPTRESWLMSLSWRRKIQDMNRTLWVLYLFIVLFLSSSLENFLSSLFWDLGVLSVVLFVRNIIFLIFYLADIKNPN